MDMCCASKDVESRDIQLHACVCLGGGSSNGARGREVVKESGIVEGFKPI
jgi:hypothetical protein